MNMDKHPRRLHCNKHSVSIVLPTNYTEWKWEAQLEWSQVYRQELRRLEKICRQHMFLMELRTLLLLLLSMVLHKDLNSSSNNSTPLSYIIPYLCEVLTHSYVCICRCPSYRVRCSLQHQWPCNYRDVLQHLLSHFIHWVDMHIVTLNNSNTR
jgi:hypothetical protein